MYATSGAGSNGDDMRKRRFDPSSYFSFRDGAEHGCPARRGSRASPAVVQLPGQTRSVGGGPHFTRASPQFTVLPHRNSWSAAGTVRDLATLHGIHDHAPATTARGSRTGASLSIASWRRGVRGVDAFRTTCAAGLLPHRKFRLVGILSGPVSSSCLYGSVSSR